MNWTTGGELELEPFQMGFLESRSRYPAFVAGWGTGKTMCAILKGMKLSGDYPNNLGLIVRKNFTDLRDSTMRDFTQYTGLKIPSSKDIILPNGSQIMFRHMDELAGIIQNVNLGWFFIEQAEEFDTEQEFEKLGGRLRRQDCFRQGFIIANTNGHNWIWRLWKDGKMDVPFRYDSGVPGIEYTTLGELFEAKSFDNAHNLPADTIADWRLKEQRSPALYRRCVLNSWEETDTADRCIPYEWLIRAVGKELQSYEEPKRVVACDPAEFGDDRTVIFGFENAKIIDSEICVKKEPMETAGRIFRMARNINAHLIGVDDIGIGAGIRSKLVVDLGTNCIGVNVGEDSEQPEDCAHIKADLWMNAQAMFREDIVSLPTGELGDKLVEELAAFSYGIDSKGRVRIEKKKKTKKKLGRSPDLADAFVIGLWLLKRVPDRPGLFPDNEPDKSTIAESYTVKSVI